MSLACRRCLPLAGISSLLPDTTMNPTEQPCSCLHACSSSDCQPITEPARAAADVPAPRDGSRPPAPTALAEVPALPAAAAHS